MLVSPDYLRAIADVRMALTMYDAEAQRLRNEPASIAAHRAELRAWDFLQAAMSDLQEKRP